MIIITGATGQLGRRVVDRLLQLVPADRIGVSVREPGRSADLAGRGVRVRRGDFDDPDSLAAAFEGATQVLLVSLNRLGGDAVAVTAAAADRAWAAGAERVLYTSHQAASAESAFAPARDHAAVEAHLARSGRPWTALRNGYYTASLAFHLGDAAATGVLSAPADGPVSWTARTDLADAAAAILADPSRIAGPTPVLTADTAVDLDDVAEMLSQRTGRTVRRELIGDDEYVDRLVRRGTPAPVAQLLLGSYLASRGGEFAVTDPTLGTLLGHPPTPLAASLPEALNPTR